MCSEKVSLCLPHSLHGFHHLNRCWTFPPPARCALPALTQASSSASAPPCANLPGTHRDEGNALLVALLRRAIRCVRPVRDSIVVSSLVWMERVARTAGQWCPLFSRWTWSLGGRGKTWAGRILSISLSWFWNCLSWKGQASGFLFTPAQKICDWDLKPQNVLLCSSDV